jgi:hypothetical protein
MPKTPKVVRMTPDSPRLIAEDEKTQRIIIGIGQQRFALDLSTQITRLPPGTGDKPAAVLAMKKKRK